MEEIVWIQPIIIRFLGNQDRGIYFIIYYYFFLCRGEEETSKTRIEILTVCFRYFVLGLVIGSTDGGFCSAPSTFDEEEASKSLYWKVTNPTLSPSHLQGLYFLHTYYYF